MNRRKWLFWDKIEKFVHKRKRAAWFEGGNCDSKCRNCKQSESLGNVIKTEPQDDESVIRSCSNCGHTWRAIFTPVGVVEVE